MVKPSGGKKNFDDFLVFCTFLLLLFVAPSSHVSTTSSSRLAQCSLSRKRIMDSCESREP